MVRAGQADVVAPGATFGEEDGALGGLPVAVPALGKDEGRGGAEPGCVDEVVLRVDDPGRGEDLGTLDGATALDVRGLGGARADDAAVLTGDGLQADFVLRVVAQRGIVLRAPEDVAPRRPVLQEDVEHAGDDLHQVILEDVDFPQQGHKKGVPPSDGSIGGLALPCRKSYRRGHAGV